jgi:hypothetical protein
MCRRSVALVTECLHDVDKGVRRRAPVESRCSDPVKDDQSFWFGTVAHPLH